MNEKDPLPMHIPDMNTPIHHTHLGPILGVLVILLVLTLGGLFLWGSMLNETVAPTPEPTIINNEPETPRATADQKILETLSPSDELDAIETDAASTNLDGLDGEMDTIQAEMDAALDA
jgi:uncharacterized protein HemX